MKALTAAEMREVDRLTTERYGISSLQLMETAGKHVADAVRQRCAVLQPRRIAILCGKGNNGGGGVAGPRRLQGAGRQLVCLLFPTRRPRAAGARATLRALAQPLPQHLH